MAFRVVFIESNAILKCKLDNLIVSINDEETWLPLTDISIIVLDNLKTSLSTRLLSVLAEENISLIICDQQHLPIGFYSSYDNHSRSSKIIDKQITISKNVTSMFWRNIVVAKLINQAMVLKRLDFSEEKIKKLLLFSEEVEAADLSNREAHGAKVYFNEMMGTSFSRGDDNILFNSGFDYGYTIIRSYLSRLCVGYGLNTQIGLHHHNEYNRFNLVDDIIEPIRPIIDLYVYHLLKDEIYFMAEHREKLVNLLNHKIRYKGSKQYLSNALETYVYSISNGFKTGDFSPVEFHDVMSYIGDEL